MRLFDKDAARRCSVVRGDGDHHHDNEGDADESWDDDAEGDNNMRFSLIMLFPRAGDLNNRT